MTDESDPQLVYADKIAKLLRKAETTDSPGEADLLTEKAQALMVKYAISEALLAVAKGEQLQDEIVKETIKYTGIFHMALFDIGKQIAVANNCKHLILTHSGKTQSDLVVIGFSKDVRNVKVLDQSLQVQASTAMQKWYRTQDVTGYTPMMKAKMRRQFLFSFAQGLGARLREANRAGAEDAVKAEAQRSGVDESSVEKSKDLVLLTKKERLDDWMDREYGKTLRFVKRNYSSGGYGASVAGYNAGKNADLGDPRLAGKKAIGS